MPHEARERIITTIDMNGDRVTRTAANGGEGAPATSSRATCCAATNAACRLSYRKQLRNDALTQIVEIPGRGHSLTIDHGWREVADSALEFVQRFAAA